MNQDTRNKISKPSIFFKNRSISRELTISLAIMISIIQVTVFFYVYSQRSRGMLESYESFVIDYSEKLKEVLAVPMWDFDYEQINIIGSGYMSNQLVSKIIITDYENNVIFRDVRNQNNNESITRKIEISYRDSIIGQVEISTSLESYYENLSRLRNVTAGSLIISLAVIFTVTGILLRIIMKKSFTIFQMGMDRVADGEFGYNVEKKVHVELAGIAGRFNEMADKIRTRENALQLVNMELLAEVKARKKTESDLREREMELKKLNEDLEKRVVLRTSELIKTNEDLENEILKHKRTESALKKSKAEAETANRTKSRFLANMSHEIRTPMNGVLGMSELLLNTGLSQQQKEYVKSIKTSGDSLLSVINDILDFSKIEAGKLELAPIIFSIRRMVSDTLNIVKNRVYAKKIDLVIDIDNNVPDLLFGDSGRLNQVLLNLVNNALKFTEDGEILVRISCEKQLEKGIELLFQVKDTGIGISEDRLNKIFNSFEQADGSTTRKFGGSGLGLSISEQLVHLMKGDIWVESSLNQGSTFYFNIIFDIPDDIDFQLQDECRNDFGGMHVMISDPNTRILKILKVMLENWDIHVITVTNGNQVSQLLETDTVNIVLFDFDDYQDGWKDACHLIHEKQMNTHIIMTSSVDWSYYAPLVETSEIDYYIQKPFVSLDIIKAIRTVLGIKSDAKMPYVDDGDFLKLKSSHKFKILLVEDTVINQEVAVQMLSMLGHDVLVARNGHEALKKIESHQFDVIMMDIQMPGMDGIETTKFIRNQEKETGSHTPIIAMTAHAMKGDRERFITAGMDGYISKPVNPASLYEVLEFDSTAKLNGITVDVINNDVQNHEEQASVSENVTLDWQALLDKFEGDEAFLQRVVSVFLNEIPNQLDSIHSALNNKDFQSLTNHSHTFKGAISNFDSGSVYQAALAIEMMSRAKDIKGAKEAFSKLREKTGILEALLNQKME